MLLEDLIEKELAQRGLVDQEERKRVAVEIAITVLAEGFLRIEPEKIEELLACSREMVKFVMINKKNRRG